MSLAKRIALFACACAPPIDFGLLKIEGGIRYLVWLLSRSEQREHAEFDRATFLIDAFRFVEWIYSWFAVALFAGGIVMLRRATRRGEMVKHFYPIWSVFMLSALTYFAYFIYTDSLLALFFGTFALATLSRIREVHVG